MQIHVKSPLLQQLITLEVDPSDTIKAVKAKIHDKEGIPSGTFTFADKPLKFGCKLSYYNIGNGFILSLVNKLLKGLIKVTSPARRLHST